MILKNDQNTFFFPFFAETNKNMNLACKSTKINESTWSFTFLLYP